MITRYFDIVRRWLWLLILTTLVAGGTTYWLGSQKPPVYKAEALLIVGPGIDSPKPDLNALRTGAQLMQTYAEMATMRPLLQTVVDDLKLELTPTQLKKQIAVKPNEEAQILSIKVESGDEAEAVAIVNAVADMLVSLSPSNPDSNQARIKAQMQRQVAKIEADIALSEARIEQLEVDFQSAEGEEQRLIMDELTGERARVTEANRTLVLLYDSLQEASVNQVKIVESAIESKRVASQLQLTVLIGAMAGLVLGGVIALAFEYFDNTIETAEELSQTVGAPLLGAIARHKTLRGNGRKRLVVHAIPGSRAAENYRMLSSKLLSRYKAKNRIIAPTQSATPLEQMVSNGNYPPRSVMLSSPQTSEDISEIAANLAVVLAQTGHRVILIDAYLHQPSLDHLFDVTAWNGLTVTLTDQVSQPELIPIPWAPGLTLLPSGPIPVNPFELLASTRMADLIEEMESQADIVLILASPLLSFADSLILASRVDGVVMVTRSGQTDRDMVADAVESLRSLGAHLIGTILDHNRPRRQSILARLRPSGRPKRPRLDPQARPQTLQPETDSGLNGPRTNQQTPAEQTDPAVTTKSPKL